LELKGKTVRITMIRSIIFLCCAPAVVARSQDIDGAASSAIRGLEREWVEAQSHNNNGALNVILDNAVVYLEYGKLVTKADYLSRIKHEDPSTDDVVMDPMTVRIVGNTAIAVGSYQETQRHRGLRTVTHWRFIDTWVYKQDGWVLIAAGATPVRE
jgi:Domain of unknown function (DUF4440)